MSHPLLDRQLRRLGLDPSVPPGAGAWTLLLERVAAAYAASDSERYLTERSFTLSSEEMRRLHDSLRRREAEQAALRRVATAVASEERPEAVFDLIAREAACLLGAEGGRIVRFADGEGQVVGSWGADEERGRVARALADRLFHSDVAAPVHVGGRLWGTVTAMSTRPEELPEDADATLSEFARMVALALASSEARAQLQQRAVSDPLTGLANHRELNERLIGEVARAQRDGHPLSVVLIDLDHFKQVNDIHGHQAGEGVLRETAARLRAVAREGELIGRVGGEEIPVGARLIALADTWDAVTVARGYRLPMSCHEALEECRRNAGSQFWPEAVRALEALVGAGALGDAGPGPRSGDAVAARP